MDQVKQILKEFFIKKYGKTTAEDYIKTGKIISHQYGLDFAMPHSTYHFDNLLNFKGRTI